MDGKIGEITNHYYSITHNNLPYYYTIRSPILHIKTRGRFDNNDYFRVPMKIKFLYNEIRWKRKEIKNNILQVF